MDNNTGQWLIDIRMIYTPKNNYQSAVIEAVREFERHTTNNPALFLDIFRNRFAELHKQWPQTKPVTINSDWFRSMKGDMNVDIIGTGGACIVAVDFKSIKGDLLHSYGAKSDLIASMSSDFFYWAEVYFSPSAFNKAIPKETAKADFMKAAGIKEISTQHFTNKLRDYAAYKGLELNPADMCNGQGRIIRDFDGVKREAVYLRSYGTIAV